MVIRLRSKIFLKRAFLLLEAELAIVILLTLVVVCISSLNHLLKAQRDNDNYLAAVLLMDERLSKVQAYGLNQTIEDEDDQVSDFSWEHNEVTLEDVLNITQLELKIGWDRKPRAGSFNVTTFILNE